MSQEEFPILCHITDKQGAFLTINCILKAPYTAGVLRNDPKLAPYLTGSHQIFIEPSVVADEKTLLLGCQEVFILAQARIHPTQWRQKRLAAGRALATK